MDFFNIDLAWIAAFLGLIVLAAGVLGGLALMYGVGSEARLRLHGRKIELKGQIEQARIRSAAAVQMEQQRAQKALAPGTDGEVSDEDGKVMRQQLFDRAEKEKMAAAARQAARHS